MFTTVSPDFIFNSIYHECGSKADGIHSWHQRTLRDFGSNPVLKMPSIYAIATAIILKFINLDLTQFFFWPSIEYMKNGLIPVALLSLGTQLYHANFSFKNWDVYIASFTRLIGGPILAYLLLNIMGIEGVMAQVLFISSSVPSAVNTALIAVEFNNEPDFASQAVMASTILSAITLTGVIYLSQHLF